MNVKIGELCRAQREEMYNLHAMFVDPDATESAFYQKRVPVKILDVTQIDSKLLYPMGSEEINQYAKLLGEAATRYPVISQGKLIDGLHRITAAVMSGQKFMEVLDFGSLINPELSGYQFDVSLEEPVTGKGLKKAGLR